MAVGPGVDRPVPQPPRESGRPAPRERGGSSLGPVLLGFSVVLVVLVLLLVVGWLTGGLSYAGWWLTNSTPPAVTLAAPPSVVRGPAQVAVQLPPRTRI